MQFTVIGWALSTLAIVYMEKQHRVDLIFCYRAWMKYALACVLATLILSAVALAQQASLDRCVGGTTYLVAFPDTTQNTFDSRFRPGLQDKFYLLLYSAVDTRAVITLNDAPDGVSSVSVFLPAGIFVEYEPFYTAVTDEDRVVSKHTWLVEADVPIAMYCYMVTKFGAEAWTPIPVEWWGTSYYAATLPMEAVVDISQLGGDIGEYNYGATPKPAPAEVLVIAAYDDTRVEFTPTVDQRHTLKEFEVTLNAGETYLLQNPLPDDPDSLKLTFRDMTGMRISSDKPVGVLSGNTRAQVANNLQGLALNSTKNMLMEWLTPIEQQGTEFVYMPPVTATNPPSYVYVYGTAHSTFSTTDGYMVDGNGQKMNFSVPTTSSSQFYLDKPQARFFKTDKPTQAMGYTTGISTFIRSIPTMRGDGVEFESWSPYMVELVPREHWVNFAPAYAPTFPPGMQHYVNIVTDKASANKIFMKEGPAAERVFTFDRSIPGTDLVWGTMPIAAGQTYAFRGNDESARFYGYTYGFWKGYEIFRPGESHKEGGGKVASGGEDNLPGVLHPSEYDENVALAYAYPFVSVRCESGSGDDLYLTEELNCAEKTITLLTLNPNPVGLKNITLENNANARLIFISPQSGPAVYKKTDAQVRVVPINPLEDASATVVIEDRSRKRTTIPYTYQAEHVLIEPRDSMDFGEVTTGTPSGTKEVIIHNTQEKSVTVTAADFTQGSEGFAIVTSNPPFPVTLKPDQKIVITLQLNPFVKQRSYIDSLRIKLGCTTFLLPLAAISVEPCLVVEDLDFDTLTVGTSKTLVLRICNKGKGILTFENPSGGNVLTWVADNFIVSDIDFNALKGARIGPDSCITINVRFDAKQIGMYKVTSTLWSNSFGCKDTSNWIAHVTQPGPQIEGYDWKKRWVVQNGCTKNDKALYDALVPIYNTGSADFKVQSVDLIGKDADSGYFALVWSDPTTAILQNDVIRSGDPMGFRRYQRVAFMPKEERRYQCTIRLTAQGGRVVEAMLFGDGVETHITVGGHQFGQALFVEGGSSPPKPGIAVLTADPTRTLTVTGLTITGEHAGDYVFAPDFVDTLPTIEYPWVLEPGESVAMRLSFVPGDSGVRYAFIIAEGDHALCDDSSGVLTGYGYIPAAEPDIAIEASGGEFGTGLQCAERLATAMYTNTGKDSAYLASFWLDAEAIASGIQIVGAASLQWLGEGDVAVISVSRADAQQGAIQGALYAEVREREGGAVIDTVAVQLRGQSFTVQGRTAIASVTGVYPGLPVRLPVTLQTNVDDGAIDALVFTLDYGTSIMTLKGLDVSGTLLEGWGITVTEQYPGRYVATLTAPAGEYLQGTGELITLAFATYLADNQVANVRYTLAIPGKQCVDILPDTTGHVAIKVICGANLRLIESAGLRYNLGQNAPNPFNPATEIEFSLGLDGPTTFAIYNALGEQVAVLVDEYMQPGAYSITWNAAGYPSGLYYYRLSSGAWSRLGTMILKK